MGQLQTAIDSALKQSVSGKEADVSRNPAQIIIAVSRDGKIIPQSYSLKIEINPEVLKQYSQETANNKTAPAEEGDNASLLILSQLDWSAGKASGLKKSRKIRTGGSPSAKEEISDFPPSLTLTGKNPQGIPVISLVMAAANPDNQTLSISLASADGHEKLLNNQQFSGISSEKYASMSSPTNLSPAENASQTSSLPLNSQAEATIGNSGPQTKETITTTQNQVVAQDVESGNENPLRIFSRQSASPKGVIDSGSANQTTLLNSGNNSNEKISAIGRESTLKNAPEGEIFSEGNILIDSAGSQKNFNVGASPNSADGNISRVQDSASKIQNSHQALNDDVYTHFAEKGTSANAVLFFTEQDLLPSDDGSATAREQAFLEMNSKESGLSAGKQHANDILFKNASNLVFQHSQGVEPNSDRVSLVNSFDSARLKFSVSDGKATLDSQTQPHISEKSGNDNNQPKVEFSSQPASPKSSVENTTASVQPVDRHAANRTVPGASHSKHASVGLSGSENPIKAANENVNHSESHPAGTSQNISHSEKASAGAASIHQSSRKSDAMVHESASSSISVAAEEEQFTVNSNPQNSGEESKWSENSGKDVSRFQMPGHVQVGKTALNGSFSIHQNFPGIFTNTNPTEFINAVAKQFQFAVSNNKQEMTVQLRPENLGLIKIRLKMENDHLSGRVEVNSQEVHQLLLKHTQELTQRLQQLDINLSNLEFELMNGGPDQQSQNSAHYTASGQGKYRQHFGSSTETKENYNIKMPHRLNLTNSTFEYIA
ncbi:MAG: flagellar hook-length control protein FliK [Calditrichia bacterium]